MNVICVVDPKIVRFDVKMRVKFPTQGSLHLCQDLLVRDRLPTLILGNHLEWVLKCEAKSALIKRQGVYTVYYVSVH